MPGTTAHVGIKYSSATDEIKNFPAEVSKPGAETIDAYLFSKILTITKRAGAYAAVSGELGLQETATAVTTLPVAATKDQIIAVTCKPASCKVSSSGGAFIYGKWLTLASKTATVTLTEDMTAFFQSDGTNWLLWGEIKSEQIWTTVSVSKATAEAGVTPSAAREAIVILTADGEPLSGPVTVGGVSLGETEATAPITIWVPAGQAWTFVRKVKAATLLR